MRTYANAALDLSTTNARRASNPARLPRAVFRTLLRAGQASPALRQRIFHVPPLPSPTTSSAAVPAATPAGTAR